MVVLDDSIFLEDYVLPVSVYVGIVQILGIIIRFAYEISPDEGVYALVL